MKHIGHRVLGVWAGGEDFVLAAGRGDLDACRAMLPTPQGSIWARDYDGQTPLHAASVGGHAHVVRWLLQERASVDAVTSSGALTPLHYAATPEVARLLLDSRASVNTHSPFYGPPLLTNTSSRHVETVELLLERKASVRAMDSLERTALHLAVHDESPELQSSQRAAMLALAELLIQHNGMNQIASKSTPYARGGTPLELASTPELHALLESQYHWSIDKHHRVPLQVQRQIETLLLVRQRAQHEGTSAFGLLANELMYEVFQRIEFDPTPPPCERDRKCRLM